MAWPSREQGQLAFKPPDELLDAGRLLHRSSVKGVYGRGACLRRGVSRVSTSS